MAKLINEFNRLPKVEREYLLRENKPLNEIKRFNRLFSVLKREMTFRLNDLAELNYLFNAYKNLRIEHFQSIKVYQTNKGLDLSMLILKTLLKSKS